MLSMAYFNLIYETKTRAQRSLPRHLKRTLKEELKDIRGYIYVTMYQCNDQQVDVNKKFFKLSNLFDQNITPYKHHC